MAEKLFTTRLWKETRNLPNLTDFTFYDGDVRDVGERGRSLFIFYKIFAFLEDAKERLKMPEYDKLFVHESLFKKKAFEDDLTFYFGANSCQLNDDKNECVKKYLEHLEKLEREDPKRLLAYVYHLYYALLRGGLIIDMKRRLERYKNDIPQKEMDFCKEMQDITEDMAEEQKMGVLVEAYYEFKKKNVKDFCTDKMMEDCTGAEPPQIEFSAALKEIVKVFTEDEKMALLDEILNIVEYNDKVMDFAGANILQIKRDLRAAMNEIAENLTEDEKMGLLAESHNVIKMNNSLVNSVKKGLCCLI